MHRPHEQGSGDRAAQGSGVEVLTSARADVEGAAGQRGQALLDEGAAAVHEPRPLGTVEPRPSGDRGNVRLVVLAQVSGVGEGDRTLVAHPRDGHRGVEPTGEGDADTLTDGEGGEDLGHGAESSEASASILRHRVGETGPESIGLLGRDLDAELLGQEAAQRRRIVDLAPGVEFARPVDYLLRCAVVSASPRKGSAAYRC